ncbi:hypothetical protein ACSBR1_013188 [Camellia fascicularis]
MTMTPYDFSMLTGIEVGGRPIPYDTDMEQFRGREPVTLEETKHYARGFLMFLFGTTLFTDRANTIGFYLLSALVDLSQVRVYDWGDAGLATLYGYMNSTSRRSENRESWTSLLELGGPPVSGFYSRVWFAGLGF